MTELERRALMGDAEAQKECTEKGIVLRCPFCGEKVFYEPNGPLYGKHSPSCFFRIIAYREDGIPKDETRPSFLEAWNTRAAPPIGRCGECKYRNDEEPTICNHPVTGLFDMLTPDDYCSYFEPKQS